ncbi:dihydropteridine reductase [Stylonychia lemnae]|uniref:Dihydropteridine reductase n=1 Tax=Stylonychia lemnae TaxID=5949 RepID=A0A078A923_STYLE|nr:dihydropteridine reductase [Stylonychia lemnae]|eukprot:CDW77303.1 dihydropteridine reductase [Stylonychia lemnae]
MSKFMLQYRQRWRKSLILVGGSSELGEEIAKRFAHSRFRKWEVINIDETANSKATKSIILKKDDLIDSEYLQKLRGEITDVSEEISTIINISTAKDVSPSLGFSDEKIFDEYENFRNSELRATMLTSHLATQLLSSNGYICFSSTVESMKNIPTDHEKARQLNYIERAMKMTQMQTALNMANSKGFNDILYQNVQINVLLWDRLSTQENRKKYPTENYREWIPCDHVASLLKLWSQGDNRPENGSFTQGITSLMTAVDESINSRKSKEQIKKDVILKIYQSKTFRNKEDAFIQWKLMIRSNEQEKTKNQLNIFDQEMTYLKTIEDDLNGQIKEIEKQIGLESKEQKRTEIWLKTKYKQQEKKFQLQSQKVLLNNCLYMHRVQNIMPAFYLLFINYSLSQVREVYKKEIASAKDVFVYEGKHQRNIFQAVQYNPPKQIKRNRYNIPTRTDQQTRNKIKQYDEIKKREAINKVQSLYKEDKNTIKYDQIIRAIKYVQRKFRLSRLRRIREEMGFDNSQDNGYREPMKIVYN